MSVELVSLVIAAFATSLLSAVLGMAGGIVLLTVMLFFFEPIAAIPLHAVVQLVSNGSRSVMQWPHVQGSVVLPFAVLLFPAAYAGVELALALPADLMRAAIGVFSGIA